MARTTTVARYVHLDLAALVPRPERLCRLIEFFAARAFSGVFVDWYDVFPWNFEPRLCSRAAYSETIVQAVERTAASTGIELVSVLPVLDGLEPLAVCGGYDHLFREGCLLFDPHASGLRKKCEEMIDDVLELLPASGRVLLGGLHSARAEPAWQRLADHACAYLGERGVEPLLWQRGSGGPTGVTGARGEPWLEIRSAAAAEGGPEASALWYLKTRAAPDTAAGPSLEFYLAALADSGGEDDEDCRRSGELFRVWVEFSRTLDAVWDELRFIAESMRRAASTPAARLRSVRGVTGRLEKAGRALDLARGLGREALVLLSPLVQDGQGEAFVMEKTAGAEILFRELSNLAGFLSDSR